MKFGPVAAQEALGAILAHSLDSANGRVPKGTVLQAEQLAALISAGHDTLVVARLDAQDVEENAAALAMAHAVVPHPEQQGLRISAAGAGRVNLYAVGPGVVSLDKDRINGANGVHPMITIATVPPFHRVDAGTMIATIKIISYGVPNTALDQAAHHAAQSIRVLPPRYTTATLVETQVGATQPKGKGRAALTGRLDRLNVDLTPRVIVAHNEQALARALSEAKGQVVCILTASATSDIHDVAPSALRTAGGDVRAYGMPVDPGNLLFFGTLGAKPVVGLPGCARSPALNGADWILERLICGVSLEQADISAMGVGGLLKEIPTRPRPREG